LISTGSKVVKLSLKFDNEQHECLKM